MAAKTKIIQGATIHYYHVLPSEIKRASVSPEREAIFQYLSRLGSNHFVDFVIDLLVHVEGHTLVGRTDGPGDEKQDILTLDPAGRRHLTQCKHTVNYNQNTAGDELDLLIGACLRKNCVGALYVTNADFTVQAKRYVTDKEYARGSQMLKEPSLNIDYWNGRRIWERVSTSHAILNKWFSGMAQAHALRRFFLDVIVTRMPQGEPYPLDATAMAIALKESYKVIPVPESRSYNVIVDDKLSLNLSNWVRSMVDLGVPFLPPDAPHGCLNVPLRTIRVQAMLSEKLGVFDVAECRNRIAFLIANALPESRQDEWWHVLATAPQSLVFIQDVEKAVLVTLEAPETFVRLGGSTGMELNWAVRPSEAFTKVRDADDPDDECWVHGTTRTTLRVFVDQWIHPIMSDKMRLHQAQTIERLRRYTIRAVRGANSEIIDTIRRLSQPNWCVLQSSNGDAFWAYPPDVEARSVERLEKVFAQRGIKVLGVRDEDRESLIERIEVSSVDDKVAVMGERELIFPVSLDKRTFWFQRDREVVASVSEEQMLSLVLFKAEYEDQHGYNLLGDKAEGRFASAELRRLLFDPFALRGRRMVDIGLPDGKVVVHLRIRDGSTSAAEKLAHSYVEEFEAVMEEVLRRAAEQPRRRR